jgi:hypothetical protein
MKAPARYSQVRKVIFTLATGRFGTGTTSNIALGIARASSTTPLATLETKSVPASTIIKGAASGPQPTQRIAYTKQGPTVTGVTNVTVGGAETRAENGQVFIIQIEFDRFEADSAEFFADWDTAAAAGADVYIPFYPIIKQVSSDSAVAHSYRFKSFNCVVVQAPTLSNKSCVEYGAYIGLIDIAIAKTAYEALVTSQARFSWTYNADDWDGISGVHACVAGSSSGSTSVTVKVAYMATASTAVTVFEEVFLTSAAFFFARTQDFKAQLVDGRIYFVDIKFNAGPTLRPHPSGYFEVIQQGFTKTVCKHQANLVKNETTSSPAGTPIVVDTTNSGASLFDPQWYQGFVSFPEKILRRRIIGALTASTSTSNNLIQRLRSDALLQSNDSLRGSATAEDIFSQTVGGTVAAGVYLTTAVVSEGDDPDLISVLGQRRLQLSIPASTWNAPVSTFPGSITLYYVLAVPNTEFPEIGDVFPIGAFNPEGCASTSAGLGDPGVLVITNGSTIPKKFVPYSGLIEDAGVPLPFEDEVPSTVVHDSASSPDGGLGIGVYKYRYTLRNCCTGKESDPNPDDIVVDTTGASPAASVDLQFAGVRIPGDEQICEICIYRTVLGGDFPVMAKVGCLDVDDPTGIFTDGVSDSALDFINDGLSLLNAPMPCVPVVVEFRNRLFAMGDIPQLSPAGTVSVVAGSEYVTGDADVVWDRCLEGKFIQLEGDCRPYEIDRVLPPEVGTSPPIARLKLIEPYEGSTRSGVLYTVCGHPNRLYISEPLEPECWPVSNFIDIEPGDGDRLMGGASNFDRLVICKRRMTAMETNESTSATPTGSCGSTTSETTTELVSRIRQALFGVELLLPDLRARLERHSLMTQVLPLSKEGCQNLLDSVESQVSAALSVLAILGLLERASSLERQALLSMTPGPVDSSSLPPQPDST